MVQNARREASGSDTYDNTVLAYLYVVPDGGSFHHRVGANVNMVSNFHGVVVERPSVRLVGWSIGQR